MLRISQDYYQGDAQYVVKVDGRQISGTLTAQVLHSQGQSDTITVKGDWGPGAPKVEMLFLSDAWGAFRSMT